MNTMYPDEDPKPVQMQVVMPSASSFVWWGMKVAIIGFLILAAAAIILPFIALILIKVSGVS